jgi:hypothetical protein
LVEPEVPWRNPAAIGIAGLTRVGGRSKTHNIKQKRLILAFPTIIEKSALRLPAVRHGRNLILCPLPVGPPVEGVRQSADLPPVSRIVL